MDQKQEMELLRREIECLRAESGRLRRSGQEAVAAYNRKKDRCDELMETLVELQARYDDLLQQQANDAGVMAQEATRHLVDRIADLEGNVHNKEESLKALQQTLVERDEEMVTLRALLEDQQREGGGIAPISSAIEDAQHQVATEQEREKATAIGEEMMEVIREACHGLGGKHGQLMGLVEQALQLLETSRPPHHDSCVQTEAMALPTTAAVVAPQASSSAAADSTTASSYSIVNSSIPKNEAREIYNKAAEGHLHGSLHVLLRDFARLRDFSGMELEACQEVMREEGEEKEKAWNIQLEEMEGELAKVKALNEEVRAQAAEQALRDSKTIQELEVAVQLTEGALSVAKANDATADLQEVIHRLESKLRDTAADLQGVIHGLEGKLKNTTADLQGVIHGLESKLREAERRRGELEESKDRLMSRLEEIEKMLRQAEERAAAAEAATTVVTSSGSNLGGAIFSSPAPSTGGCAMRGRRPTPSEGGIITSLLPSDVNSGGEGGGYVGGEARTTHASTSAELRHLKAELQQTKAQLDTAKTNTSLLQRYIAVKKSSFGSSSSGSDSSSSSSCCCSPPTVFATAPAAAAASPYDPPYLPPSHHHHHLLLLRQRKEAKELNPLAYPAYTASPTLPAAAAALTCSSASGSTTSSPFSSSINIEETERRGEDGRRAGGILNTPAGSTPIPTTTASALSSSYLRHTSEDVN